MKLKKINSLIYAFLSAIIVVFSSCEDNELDVNAEWKETIIVYGLLDINADTQFLRIQKAFLNPDADALEIAQIADSLYFKNLDVVVNSNTGDVITFEPINRGKDTGIFASQPNILYYSTTPLDISKTYSLVITNKESGNIVTAQTDLVRNPSGFIPIANPFSKFRLPPGDDFQYSFSSGVNSRIYDVIITFNYTEFNKDGSDTVHKSLDWKVQSNKRVNSTAGNLSVKYSLNGTFFLDYLSNTIPVDTNLNRMVENIDMTYYGGSEELNLYVSVNKPSIGIVQKKPEYTNIENGLGLFTSRNITAIKGVDFSEDMVDYLINRPETEKLNFVK